MINAVHDYVRSKVEHLEEDQIMYEMMEKVIEMVQDGTILEIAVNTAEKEGVVNTTVFTDLFEKY
ncbi:hypothetical protein D3C86_2040480 [compost metagenome]